MTRAEMINEAIAMVQNYESLDIEADLAERSHEDAVAALTLANQRAALDNQAAEQQLILDEASAATAYDQALQTARGAREAVRRAAEQAIQAAQVTEQTKLALKQDARRNVEDLFEMIKEKLIEAAAAPETVPA